jgi:hypothetical protein
MTTYKYLGLDPGTKNFGFSLVEHDTIKWRILECGMMENTLYDFGDDFKNQINWFIDEIGPMLSKADHVVMERYQPRFKAAQIEYINCMIGIVAMLHKSTRIVTAASWKNKLPFKLKDLYDKKTDHVLDATLMAMLDSGYKIDKQFIKRVQTCIAEFKK